MNDIKQFVFDVDGTLTDGGIIISGDGVEIKRFSDADGLIMRCLPDLGCVTAVITGRSSPPVEARARDLRIFKVYHGVKDKIQALHSLCAESGVPFSQTAYIGNDLNDYAVMKQCGFKACPIDAAAEIKAIADYVSPRPGGHGAVRDILEHLLKKNGMWEKLLLQFGISAPESAKRVGAPGSSR